jgi:tetratricopeptide (TPR) repeat protein
MRASILALALLVLIPALPAESGPSDKLLDLADVHMRHRDFASALSYYDKAIAAEPDSALARLSRNEAVRRGGTDPLPECEQVWSEKPDDPARIVAYASLLPPEKALEVLSRLPSPDFYASLVKVRAFRALGRGETSSEAAIAEGKCPTGDVRALSLLAAFFEEAERYEKAADLYGRALEVDPRRIEALVGQASALRFLGKFDEAVKSLEAAAKLDKEDPEIPYRLGLVHISAKNGEAAVKALLDALGLGKDQVDVILALGDAQLLLGRTSDAESLFAKAVEIAPRRVDARRRYGYALDLVEKNDEALEQYQQLLKLDPLNAPCRVAIGWIFAKKGKFDEALKEFRQAADLDAKDPVAPFFVGYTFDLMGKWGEAVEAYEKVTKKFPTYARAWNNLGLDHDLLGKGSAALTCAKKAVDLDPDNSEYMVNLGNVYYNAKKFKEAVDVFSRLVDQDPASTFGFTGLGRSLNQLRRYKEAADAYESAIALVPDQSDLHLLVGIIYQENLKDYQKALDHYDEYIRLGGDDPVVQGWIEEAQAKLKK